MNKIVIFQITFATDFFPTSPGEGESGDPAINAPLENHPFALPCIGPPFFTNEIRQRFAAKIFRPPGFLEENARHGTQGTTRSGVSSECNDLSRACHASKQLGLMKTKQRWNCSRSIPLGDGARRCLGISHEAFVPVKLITPRN